MKPSIFEKSTADYSTPAKRRQLVKEMFYKVEKAYAFAGRSDALWEPDKRKKAVLGFMEEISAKYKQIGVESVEETLLRFEAMNYSSYERQDECNDYTLAAALWILDDLRKTGNLYKATAFLPKSFREIEDIYCRVNFYHPCYEDELVNSVMYVVDPENLGKKTREAFKGIVGLLDQERVAAAAEYFRQLEWRVIDCQMKADAYFSKQRENIRKQFRDMDTPNILQVDRVVPRDDDLHELADRYVDMAEDRNDFISHFEDYIGCGERRILGIRELGRIMGEFSVDDPYAAAFGLSYLIATDDDMAWLTKAGIAAISAAARFFPWYMDTDQMDDEEYEEWYEGPTFNGNGWLDREPSSDSPDYHRPGPDGITPAQRIYRLSRGIVPATMHPFETERQQMKEDGIKEADMIADWSEAMFLASFRARALNIENGSWDEIGVPWDERDIPAVDEAEEEPADQKEPDYIQELECLKRENKSLRNAYSELKRDTDARLAKNERELKALRRDHRELADLREIVFNAGRPDNEEAAGKDAEAVSKKTEFPYTTQKRTVIFGGHDTFLKAIRPMLPDVKYVDVRNMAFSPEIIRNADVVWIQTNCMSHSQYASIVRYCKQAGVQMRYFVYAGAEKCAEQVVAADETTS